MINPETLFDAEFQEGLSSLLKERYLDTEKLFDLIAEQTYVGHVGWVSLVNQMVGFTQGVLEFSKDNPEAPRSVCEALRTRYTKAEQWAYNKLEETLIAEHMEIMNEDWHEGHPSNYGDR